MACVFPVLFFLSFCYSASIVHFSCLSNVISFLASTWIFSKLWSRLCFVLPFINFTLCFVQYSSFFPHQYFQLYVLLFSSSLLHRSLCSCTLILPHIDLPFHHFLDSYLDFYITRIHRFIFFWFVFLSPLSHLRAVPSTAPFVSLFSAVCSSVIARRPR